MRKTILLLTMIIAAMGAQAQITSGYYKVINKATNRMISIQDNTGYVTTSDRDLTAIVMKEASDDNDTDPSTVIYMNYTNDGYDMSAQGTSTYEMVKVYVKAEKQDDGSYICYYRHSTGAFNISAYVVDRGGANNNDNTAFYFEGSKKGNCYWYVEEITRTSDHSFGARPDLVKDGKYYTTLYASFPYQLSSTIKAYYVNGYENGTAYLTEITDIVPAGTAVLLESSGTGFRYLLPVMSNKKLDGTNLLKGVYFNNAARKNQTAYNAATMRVLTTNSGSTAVWGKSGDAYLAANKAYLDLSSVKGSIPDEITFEVGVPSGIQNLQKDVQTDRQVYDLQGRRVQNTARHGIYIVNGKKVVY